MPFVATVYSVRTAPRTLQDLFAPLGYAVTVSDAQLLDEQFPEWGRSDVYTVTLSGEVTVRELLTHLYVLIPVLDSRKHYFVGDDEVEKLLRKGEGWLAQHPEKEEITSQYLLGRRRLTSAALARLEEIEESGTPEASEQQEEAAEQGEERLEKPVRLNDLRIAATVAAVQSLAPPAKRVLDLGCGEGKTMAAVLGQVSGLDHVSGMDVATIPLEKAARRLHVERMTERERSRVSLFQGSLVYRDARLSGYDVALLNEVVEHLDSERLKVLVRVVFEYARPRRVVVTTPNAEYNSVWSSLPAGKYRHADHRFEWTRAEFHAWAETVARDHGYTVTFSGIGEEDPDGRGTPTQMGIFDLL
jgi:3' terminal RNA ribose 2'-O-methyltransferase Hen1